MEIKQFAVILTSFAEMVGKDLTPNAIRMYYNVIKGYSSEQINTAANHILRTHKFNTIPLPALFVEAIEGNNKDKAIDAWEYVVKSVERGKRGVTDDEVSNATVKKIGGIKRGLTYDELKFMRKDFIEAYGSVTRLGNINALSKSEDVNRLVNGICK